MTERKADSELSQQVDFQGTPGGVLPRHMEKQFGVGVEGDLITTKPRAGESAVVFEKVSSQDML